MPTPISDSIARYEAERPVHGSGTLDIGVLRELERLVSGHLTQTIETGCGKSTILFSRLSAHHTVFTADDTALENSSVDYYRQCPYADHSRTTLVLGPTQQTLRSFDFATPLDLVFLDGPHGYPFPELEYYYTYPHLRTGAWLIVDDVHIPTIHRFYEFLREDEMFEHVALVRTTAVFRRTAEPTFNPLGDGWWLQRFNKARFPVELERPSESSTPSAQIERAAATLQAELEQARAQEQWWRHVADERRLRRRFARRVERLRQLLPFGRS
jgi:predicted O-methyltransferase YrrM